MDELYLLRNYVSKIKLEEKEINDIIEKYLSKQSFSDISSILKILFKSKKDFSSTVKKDLITLIYFILTSADWEMLSTSEDITAQDHYLISNSYYNCIKEIPVPSYIKTIERYSFKGTKRKDILCSPWVQLFKQLKNNKGNLYRTNSTTSLTEYINYINTSISRIASDDSNMITSSHIYRELCFCPALIDVLCTFIANNMTKTQTMIKTYTDISKATNVRLNDEKCFSLDDIRNEYNVITKLELLYTWCKNLYDNIEYFDKALTESPTLYMPGYDAYENEKALISTLPKNIQKTIKMSKPSFIDDYYSETHTAVVEDHSVNFTNYLGIDLLKKDTPKIKMGLFSQNSRFSHKATVSAIITILKEEITKICNTIHQMTRSTNSIAYTSVDYRKRQVVPTEFIKETEIIDYIIPDKPEDIENIDFNAQSNPMIYYDMMCYNLIKEFRNFFLDAINNQATTNVYKFVNDPNAASTLIDETYKRAIYLLSDLPNKFENIYEIKKHQTMLGKESEDLNTFFEVVDLWILLREKNYSSSKCKIVFNMWLDNTIAYTFTSSKMVPYYCSNNIEAWKSHLGQPEKSAFKTFSLLKGCTLIDTRHTILKKTCELGESDLLNLIRDSICKLNTFVSANTNSIIEDIAKLVIDKCIKLANEDNDEMYKTEPINKRIGKKEKYYNHIKKNQYISQALMAYVNYNVATAKNIDIPQVYVSHIFNLFKGYDALSDWEQDFPYNSVYYNTLIKDDIKRYYQPPREEKAKKQKASPKTD